MRERSGDPQNSPDPPPADSTRQTKAATRSTLAAYSITMRVLVFLLLAGILFGAWTLTSNYLLYQHGQKLAREIEAEQLTDLDQIWARWTELSKGNPSSFLLHGPRKVVKQKFLAAADHVIDTYQITTNRSWFMRRSGNARVPWRPTRWR